MVLQRFNFSCGIATLGLHPLEAVAGGGETGIVLVELAGERLLGRAGIGELDPGGFEFNGAQSSDGKCGFGPLFGLGEGSACGTRTRCSDPPTAHTEAIPGGGNHDGRWMGQRHVDGFDPTALHHDRSADEGIEQWFDIGPTGPHMRPNRFTL